MYKARDGDGKQAVNRISALVKRGQMFRARELLCWDCEDTAADEYDHARGYEAEFHEYVEPVCYMCHAERHRQMRLHGNPRHPTVAWKAKALTPPQRAILQEMKTRYEQRNDAMRAYHEHADQIGRGIAEMIVECRNQGVSVGVMAHELGVSTQALYALLKRVEGLT